MSGLVVLWGPKIRLLDTWGGRWQNCQPWAVLNSGFHRKANASGREPMEENHEDIGRRILNQLHIQYDHFTTDGIYGVLFKPNYLRGVEYSGLRGIRVENDGLHGLTEHQQEYLDERRLQLGGPSWKVHFNDRQFMETR